MIYVPDVWTVVKILGDDPHYRVLGGWYGGYTSGDSWRLNSGITKVIYDNPYYLFGGSSSSVYKCHEESYRLSSITASVLQQLEDRHKDKVILMNEDTDWKTIDWIIH
jgi:hypothetical protein